MLIPEILEMVLRDHLESSPFQVSSSGLSSISCGFVYRLNSSGIGSFTGGDTICSYPRERGDTPLVPYSILRKR